MPAEPARTTPLDASRPDPQPVVFSWLCRNIAVVLAVAREKGLDDVDQTGHAVRAVLAAIPDMTASDALQAVNRWRRG